MTPRRRAPIEHVVTAMFVAVLCIPLLARGIGVGRNARSLRFETTELPALRLSPTALLKFPGELKDYFNTHFAFRDVLMELHAHLKVNVFGVSSSDRVTLGKDGWLFYAGERIVDDYRRTYPLRDDELAKWAVFLVKRRDALRARGIPFALLIAPNAQTIYPEYMPDELQPANRPSRFDQLVDYLRAHTDVDVIDVRPALRAAKRSDRVYYKTDTHWNQLGGFVAYQELARWLQAKFPAWRPDSLDAYERVETPNWHGGLSYFLGDPSLFSETRVELRPRDARDVRSDGVPLPTDETFDAWTVRRHVVRTSADGELPTALVLRDSQFAAPAQFLSRHFRRTVLVWRATLDPQLIVNEAPTVVIQEIAERFLMNDVLDEPPLP